MNKNKIYYINYPSYNINYIKSKTQVHTVMEVSLMIEFLSNYAEFADLVSKEML